MSLAVVADLYSSRRNLFLSSKDLEEMQVKKIRRLLTFAYDNVPFYHEKLRSAGIKPIDVQRVEDIRKIPATSKTELQRTPLNKIVARDVNIEKCVKSRTSGSTGLPLTTLASQKT